MSQPDVKLTGIWKHFNSHTIRGRSNVSSLPFRYVFSILGNMCSFTLTEMDSGTGSDSDSKPDGYIVLCRTYPHCTDFDSNPYSLFLCRTGIRIGVRTQVLLWQYKWDIKLYESSNGINLKQKEKLGVHPCVAKKHSGQSTKGIWYNVFVPCFEYVQFEEKKFWRRYQVAPEKKSIH